MPAKPRAIVAEFHKSAGGRLTLWAVTTLEDEGHDWRSRTQYDVEHSRKYGYLFHQSGGGGGEPINVSGIYFVSGGAKVKENPCDLVDARDRPPWKSKRTRAIRKRNRTRQLRALPKAFDLEPGQDLLDWLQCRGIESDAVHCGVCRDWLPEDDACRHVFWCDGEWAGSGIGPPDDGVRASLFKLLDALSAEFSADLRKAILSGRFHTWLVAPLIGSGGDLTMHGMPYKWGSALMKLEGAEDAEDYAQAYRWLASLYDNETKAANRATIAIIDAWRRRRLISRPRCAALTDSIEGK